MAAAKPPAGLHFLVSTNVEKPNPELRKFIRSHVMLGKNRGKTRAARKRALKGVHYESTSDSYISSSRSGIADADLAGSSTPSTTASDPVLPATVPRKFGYFMAATRFPDAVEPGAVEVVLQFSSIAKQVLFPLEACILFEKRAEMWIASLSFDPAYLHTMIFITRSFYEVRASRKSSVAQATFQHFLRALELLRERMGRDDDHSRLSDATVSAIMSIASHALLTEDYNSARHHIEGLHKIVNLRGGFDSFQQNKKLLTDILRCDIGMALHTGSRPVFFRDIPSWESFLQYPDLTFLRVLQKPAAMASQSGSARFLGDIDDELYRAWKAMSDFCSVINFAMDSKQYISFNSFADTMASVMYRLIDMPFTAGSSNETLRLGLLAYSISVFPQWKHLGLSYAHFTSVFRGCLARLASLEIFPQLLLWLLMVGAVSVFDDLGDAWLKDLLKVTIRLCEIDSWSKMEDLLNSFMWIGLVQDKSARSVFNAVVAY